MTTAVLSLLVLASALLNVRAEYKDKRRQVYVFKPLTVVIVILIALQTKHTTATHYRQLVVAGLICSLAGDVLLMLPRERFVAGLVCFLLAHLCYIAAFTTDGARTPSVWGAVILVLYGALMLRVLSPHLGKLKAPVSVYVAAILLMAWQALNRWTATGDAGGALAFAGSLAVVGSGGVR